MAAIVEISEFRGAGIHGNTDQMADGAPALVTQLEASDEFTAADKTAMIRILPLGDAAISITWANGQAETFASLEYRAVRDSDFPFTVSAL